MHIHDIDDARIITLNECTMLSRLEKKWASKVVDFFFEYMDVPQCNNAVFMKKLLHKFDIVYESLIYVVMIACKWANLMPRVIEEPLFRAIFWHLGVYTVQKLDFDQISWGQHRNIAPSTSKTRPVSQPPCRFHGQSNAVAYKNSDCSLPPNKAIFRVSQKETSSTRISLHLE